MHMHITHGGIFRKELPHHTFTKIVNRASTNEVEYTNA